MNPDEDVIAVRCLARSKVPLGITVLERRWMALWGSPDARRVWTRTVLRLLSR